MQSLKNVVLVHGAWADGSSWSKIVPLLQTTGLHVACAQIPLSSIADDVASTNRLINAQDGPVLLVGHSYGSAVITVARYHPKVSGLVYVDAFAPAKGVSEDFAQDLSPEEKNNMVATQGPTQGAILSTKITKAAWHAKPSWFVISDNDRMISPEQERATAKRMGAKTLSLPTSHVAMLAKPKEVAEFIIGAAASLSSSPLAKAS